jgi:two-component system chemotaxis response regulator CheY
MPVLKRILVVDDMMTMRKIVSKACRDAGCIEVVEAADGAIAWGKVQEPAEIPFEMIISDWNMPNSSGIELLKNIRADARYQHLPFILVTAESEAAQIAEALKAGADNYVVKPFSPAALKNKIEETLNKKAGKTAA